MNIDLYNYQDWSGNNPNHNPLTWAVWGILTVTMLALIVFGIVWSVIYYRKTNKKFLTAPKITIFATYLAFFLVQAFLMSPLLKLPIPFSIDSITTVAVGFIFGPLEGIMFGWVADTLRVFINGWSYQLLPGLMYPMIGLISAVFGILYRKYDELPNWLTAVLFQSVIFAIILIIIPMNVFLSTFAAKHLTGDPYFDKLIAYQIPGLISAVVCLLLMEGIYVSFFIFKWNTRDMFLITLVLLASTADRSMELVIRPFTQYFTGYEQIYIVSLYTRMLSSAYLIPAVAITSAALIKASLYTLDIVQRDNKI